MRNNKKNAFENILMKIGYEFKNKVYSIVESDQKDASNFGKQWKGYFIVYITELFDVRFCSRLLTHKIIGRKS